MLHSNYCEVLVWKLNWSNFKDGSLKLTGLFNSLINLDSAESIFLLSSLLILFFQVWLFIKQRMFNDSDKTRRMALTIEKMEVEFKRLEDLIDKAIEKVVLTSKDKVEQSFASEKRVRNDFANLEKQNLEIIQALKDLMNEVVHQQVTRHKLNDIFVAKVDKKMEN